MASLTGIVGVKNEQVFDGDRTGIKVILLRRAARAENVAALAAVVVVVAAHGASARVSR